MSAVLEREVSQGFPADGKMFEPPEVNRDNEQPRYMVVIGSMVAPETIQSRPWTKGGGIEVSNPCLRVVKNFLRKGRITPLLKDTHDFLPFDLVRKTTEINPLQAGYFGQPIPKGYTPPALPPANGQFQPGFGNLAIGGPSPYGNMVGKLALPGEQVNAILIGTENMAQNNVPRGIRELKSLRGRDYRPQSFPDGSYVDPAIREMQLAIFPTYPVLPVLLDEIEQILNNAPTSLREIVDEMHESLIEFRSYAETTIQAVHNNMKESAGRRGYVWRYTAMDLVLLEQLGMDRQDRQIRAQAQSGDAEFKDMFKQFLESQAEERKARIEADKRVERLLNSQTLIEPVSETFAPSDYAGDRIDAQTMMASPEFGDAGQQGQEGTSGVSGASGQITNATSEGQEQINVAMADSEKFECVCGREAGSKAGLLAHQRHCDAVKAQNLQ
jgi:hypothetical protein